MIKKFDHWNEEKKHIHTDGENRFYHEREMWWCSLGVNIGFEQDGTGSRYERPVLIIKGFSRNTCVILPLTSSPKKHPLRIPVGIVDGKQASALLSQMRIIDTKRFTNRIGFLDESVFDEIRKAVKVSL